MTHSVDPRLVARILSELRARHRGAERAIRGRDLADKLGVDRLRTVQEAIEYARLRGWRICGISGAKGYFLPASSAERLWFEAEMLRRERAIRRVRLAFRRGRSSQISVPATRRRRAA